MPRTIVAAFDSTKYKKDLHLGITTRSCAYQVFHCSSTMASNDSDDCVAGSSGAPTGGLDADKLDFALHISKQMQVPERIKLLDDNGEDRELFGTSQDSANNTQGPLMHVPDRLIVVGGRTEAGSREAIPPETVLEERFLDRPSLCSVPMASAPETLRIEDTSFEQANDGDSGDADNGHLAEQRNATSYVHQLGQQLSEQLNRSLTAINDRLGALEAANRRRKTRNYVLYTGLILYGILRGMRFLALQNRF